MTIDPTLNILIQSFGGQCIELLASWVLFLDIFQVYILNTSSSFKFRLDVRSSNIIASGYIIIYLELWYGLCGFCVMG
jgi:hypothetical protein